MYYHIVSFIFIPWICTGLQNPYGYGNRNINFLYDYASMKNTSHSTVLSTSNHLMLWRKKFWDGFCCLQFYKQNRSTPWYQLWTISEA